MNCYDYRKKKKQDVSTFGQEASLGHRFVFLAHMRWFCVISLKSRATVLQMSVTIKCTTIAPQE